MNEKLQQCGVQLPPSKQDVSGKIILQAEGAITGLFAAPEEKVSFCLWPEEVKGLQMFYIPQQESTVMICDFFFFMSRLSKAEPQNRKQLVLKWYKG